MSTMIHDLKIWPQYYCRIVDGTLTFQSRKNDREFQFGDTVILREWNPSSINSTDDAPKGYTDSKPLEFMVGFVLPHGSSHVVFSLLPAKKPSKS